MTDELMRSIDTHLEHGEELMRLNRAAFDRNTEAFERNREAFDRNAEASDRNTAALDRHEQATRRILDENRQFMREMTGRSAGDATGRRGRPREHGQD